MAEFYSDAFAPAAVDITEVDKNHRPEVGLVRGVKYYKRNLGQIAVGVVSTDVLHMTKHKSSDRLIDLTFTDVGASTVTAADVGLYLVDPVTGNGTVIDVDLFASALALNAGGDRVDAFDEAGTLDFIDRGKMLWELATIGAASYTEDPMRDFYISLTLTGSVTTATEVILLEDEFTIGR